MWLSASNALALGLGRMSVQSALNETLRAEIDVTSLTPEESSTLNVRVAPPDSYRAAGVDYNPVLPGTKASLLRRADGRPYLRISSDRVVQEPFVDLILELTWASGRLVREYTLLIDPPVARAPQPAPAAAAAPSVSAAPAPAPTIVQRAPAAAPAQATAPAPVRPVTAAPARERPQVDEYTVRPGDTLSRIAARTQRSGVSLDQMLVALFKGNPQAFIDNNMNLLKSGARLAVPDAQTAGATSADEARQVVRAQSADFSAYRQRLAGVAPAAAVDASSRQSAGKVQAEVQDRKAAAAPAPDRLTLSKAAAAASAVEAKVSKESAKKEAGERVAELAKNVEDLKKLSGATAPAAPAPTPAPAAAPTPAPAAAPTPAPAAAPTPAPAAAPTPAPAPTPATGPAPTVVAAAPAPTPAPVPAPAAAAADEPDMLATVLDNPLVLPGAGVLVALLVGFGIYRLRSTRKESGETSFLESRLQPDSFFGASGGQRIDTRDAGGASSSMSYSLSQLDAIGDVDPVAEADVYLAYGRDLQAEEILKEAMRANPDRLAIRAKLLEVYAKRRDTKGFELLATQMYTLTRGEGEDWAKAQELGVSIDPDNPMYQPGGAPAALMSAGGAVVEPLGASTMPQSVLPSPSQYEQSRLMPSQIDESAAAVDVDLDLGAPMDAPARPAPVAEVTRPMPPVAAQAPDLASLDQPDAHARDSKSLEFDLSDITLDLDSPPSVSGARMSEHPGDALDDLAAGEDADPLVRKLELAEEFRQIGDTDGARDLLREVVARAEGGLKAKAQGMLDNLG